MNFDNFIKEVNQLNIKSKEDIQSFIENIDITSENVKEWIDGIFSEKISEIDFEKLPYVIDELYKSNDKLRFMLCCMLIESTCMDLPFITNLENYPLFQAKYEMLKPTLITVYSTVDNGIANCMALILLHNDPEFSLLEKDEKDKLIEATNRKLGDIIGYLKNTKEINPLVYRDLEVIIDLANYMDNEAIKEKIEEIQILPLDATCKLFLAKYKLIHKMNITADEIESLIANKKDVDRVVSIFEKYGGIDKLPMDRITQEDIAEAAMINWLSYPTELGKEPDEIELLGKLELDNIIYYIYRFKCSSFRIKDYMLAVAGGYEKDKLTSNTTGVTFSKFEPVKTDFMQQAKEIVEFISGYWSNRAQQ